MTNLPVTGAFRVTCEYGKKGSLWSAGWHKGIDLVCDNRDVYSSCDGVVKTVGWDPNGWGRYVRVQEQTTGLIHIFCHLVNDSVRVRVGQAVSRATILGTMGTTGNSTGVHVHFQIEDGARNVYDPTQWLKIPNKVGLYNSEDYHIDKEADPTVVTFKDQDTFPEWAAADIQELAELGVVMGDEQGNFNPYNNTTRAEMAVALNRAIKVLSNK